MVTGDGSPTFFDESVGEAFHSRHGAATEAVYVFLEGSGAAERLASGSPLAVLEVGFGTGLNFSLTAEAALAGGAALRYVALERAVLPAGALAALGFERFAPRVAPALVEWRAALPRVVPPGVHEFRLGSVSLDLVVGEATNAAWGDGRFDAVYQDAFSPGVNPELWTEEFLGRLARALVPGGHLVSYCVQGEVRRRLAGLGLEVTKRPGPPGGKREVLTAVAGPS